MVLWASNFFWMCTNSNPGRVHPLVKITAFYCPTVILFKRKRRNTNKKKVKTKIRGPPISQFCTTAIFSNTKSNTNTSNKSKRRKQLSLLIDQILIHYLLHSNSSSLLLSKVKQCLSNDGRMGLIEEKIMTRQYNNFQMTL